jgi:hypothetical protein
MRKLLHLTFAVWSTDKPFDPAHHPWERVTDSAVRAPDEGVEGG